MRRSIPTLANERRSLARLIVGLWLASTASSATAAGVVFDLSYGPHPSQKFDWYLPDHATASSPLVVFIHGAHGILDKSSINEPLAVDLRDLLLVNGITVVSIDDHPFPEFIYPTQINDAKLAIQHCRDQASALAIDPARVAIWGWSSGSTVAALVAYGADLKEPLGQGASGQSSRPDRYLNWRGQTNWLLMHPSYPGIMFGKATLAQVDPGLLKEASGAEAVLAVARTSTPPVLSYFSTLESPPPLLNPHDATLMKDLHAKLGAFPEVAADSVMMQNPIWPTLVPGDLVAQLEWLRGGFGLSNEFLFLGHAKPGSAGSPTLLPSGSFAAGGAWQLDCQAAAAAVPLLLVTGGAGVYLPLLGGTMVPSPDLITVIPTDGSGAATLAGQVPASLAPLVIYAQLWHWDANAAGYAASSAVKIRAGT